jgi:hypothetical protein
MTQAIDTDSTITKQWLDELKIKNALPEAIALYSRNLTLAVVELLSSYGINIITIFEALGDRYSSFSTAFGKVDAARFLQQAARFNQPKGTFVYVCASDYDCNAAQAKGGVHDYFVEWNSIVVPEGYHIGSYGNGLVNQYLLDNKLTEKCWLWGVNQSYGTQDFLKSNRWSIHQHITTNLYGVSVDGDDLNGDYGGWRLDGSVMVPSAPVAPPKPPVKVTATKAASKAQEDISEELNAEELETLK